MKTIRRMTTTATAIATVGLVGLSAAVASAEPGSEPPATPIITMVPERPSSDGLSPFADNPAVVDTHPLSIDSWSRLPERETLAVHFTTGTPECFGVHAEVQETADIVAVKLRSGTLPEATERACTMIAVFGTLPVALQAPVGDRAVVSIT